MSYGAFDTDMFNSGDFWKHTIDEDDIRIILNMTAMRRTAVGSRRKPIMRTQLPKVVRPVSAAVLNARAAVEYARSRYGHDEHTRAKPLTISYGGEV